MILLALVISLLLNDKKLKCKGLFRTAIFLPCVTSLVAYSIIFKSLFATDGFINTILMKVNLISEPIAWITDPVWAKILIIIAITWRWTGYNMVFYLSGLQGIDDYIYEAAEHSDGSYYYRGGYSIFDIFLPAECADVPEGTAGGGKNRRTWRVSDIRADIHAYNEVLLCSGNCSYIYV